MLQGCVLYLDQYKYIQEMLWKFRIWANDASLLLLSKDEHFFVKNLVPRTISFLQNCLIRLTCGAKVFVDFLPDGKYGKEPSDEIREKMKHSKLTNLLSENEFGELDFRYYKRRNASLFYHSGVQMVKRTKTLSVWLSAKSPSVQTDLLKMVRTKSNELRSKQRNKELAVRKQYLERLEKTHQSKKQKKEADRVVRETFVSNVATHGGPCKTPDDVHRVLSAVRFKKDIKAILRDEFGYCTNALVTPEARCHYGFWSKPPSPQ